jgi:hypothetical protein
MIALGMPQGINADLREITRVAPKDWPQEIKDKLLPTWKDAKGKPLPLDSPLFDLKGNLLNEAVLSED